MQPKGQLLERGSNEHPSQRHSWAGRENEQIRGKGTKQGSKAECCSVPLETGWAAEAGLVAQPGRPWPSLSAGGYPHGTQMLTR